MQRRKRRPQRFCHSLHITVFDPTMQKRLHILSNGGPEGINHKVDTLAHPSFRCCLSNSGPEGGQHKPPAILALWKQGLDGTVEVGHLVEG